MKKFTLALIIILSSIILTAQQSYYDDVDLNLTGINLKNELATKITSTHSNTLSYDDAREALKIVDLVPNQGTYVFLVYGFAPEVCPASTGNDNDHRRRDKSSFGGGSSCEWNREHTYPQSLGTPALGQSGPGADAHMLRAADVQRNGSRSSKRFVDGSGNSGDVGGSWYPGDEWKGDMARIMMYMYLRYGDRCRPNNVGIGNAVANDSNMIDLFLQWNADDPVSDYEKIRNTYLELTSNNYGQGNRNPFIDNPFLATRIWGGPQADDLWGIYSNDDEAPSAATNLVVSDETFNSMLLSWNAATDNVGVTAYDVYKDGVLAGTTSNTSYTLTGLSPETDYELYVVAKDVVGNESTASSTITGTTLPSPYAIFEDFNDCSTVNNSFVAYNEASNKDWDCIDTNGFNNTGCYQVNGYQSDVASKDWLITTNPIDFSQLTNESLSVYLVYKYGSTPLELVYSTDYTGTGNPANALWTAMPNVVIDTPTGSTEGTQEIVDVDISSLSQSTYIAFKYYANASPTRWNVDNFAISADSTTGIDDLYNQSISIHPNPTSDIITLNSNSSIKYIQLYNLLGQEVLQRKIEKNEATIDLSKIISGTYIIKISFKNNHKAFKVIKQ